MNPQPPLSPLSPVKSGSECAAYLSAFLTGLCDYDLRPKERHFLCLLASETFGKNRLAVTVDFDTWSRRLGLDRPQRVRVIFLELISLGIIDHDPALALVQLRPDCTAWCRSRALRSGSSRLNTRESPSSHEPELPLKSERFLAEALTETSRENSLAGGRAQAPRENSLDRQNISPSSLNPGDSNPDPDRGLQIFEARSVARTQRTIQTETEFLHELRAVLGPDAPDVVRRYPNAVRDGGKWLIRFRSDPEKCWRVLHDTRDRVRQHRNTGHPAATMENTWKEFS